MPPPSADFRFEIGRLVDIDLDAFRPFFERLPVDHYVEGEFRRRRLSRFTADGAHLPHSAFMQSGYVNHLLGNIQRDYEEVEDELIDAPCFRHLLEAMVAFFDLPAATVLGVHQIRIVCEADLAGHPAPEGVHQDGFDYIAIACIARHNVAGGKTGLYEDPDGEPVFERELEPGEVAWCDDRRVYHYTTPMHPREPGSGHRDVFVITAALPESGA